MTAYGSKEHPSLKGRNLVAYACPLPSGVSVVLGPLSSHK